MTIPAFAVTYDYRCPFARNAHEHVVAALDAGAGWDVEFVPFSLSQVHIEEGSVAVWDDPEKAPHLLAMEASIAARLLFPDQFLQVHLAMFAARHDDGRDLHQEDVVADVLRQQEVDADAVLAAIKERWPRVEFRRAHEAAVAEHSVFGVPTFIAGNVAVFARIMSRPGSDPERARSTIEHVMGLVVGHPDLNEFKHTTISR
ncbi:MAG: DsbA family protein [Acidimicrobiales bacterium]